MPPGLCAERHRRPPEKFRLQRRALQVEMAEFAGDPIREAQLHGRPDRIKEEHKEKGSDENRDRGKL